MFFLTFHVSGRSFRVLYLWLCTILLLRIYIYIFRELFEKKRQKKDKLDYYSLFEVSVSVLHVPCVCCVTYKSSQNYAFSFFWLIVWHLVTSSVSELSTTGIRSPVTRNFQTFYVHTFMPAVEQSQRGMVSPSTCQCNLDTENTTTCRRNTATWNFQTLFILSCLQVNQVKQVRKCNLSVK